MEDPIVFITELGGRMLWANEALERQTGYTLDHFQYDNPDNPFIHPDDLPVVTQHFVDFAASEATVSDEVENRFFTAWGEAFRFRSTLTKVVFEGQQAFRVECHRVWPDRPPTLAEMEARFRRLVETATDAVLRTDAHDVLLYANRRFHEWVQQSPLELRGRKLTEFLVPEDRRAATDALREARELGTAVKFVGRMLDEEGAVRWIGARAVGLTEGDDAGSVQAILRDITETRRLEEQLRHAQKLESLGVFAGGIAHDFNNLLTGVLANASRAQDRARGGHDVTDELDAIRLAAERAATLTRSMLAFAGGAYIERRLLDLDEVVAEVLALARAAITARVQLDVQRAPRPVVVSADEAQLTQVVLNLVTNAAEATGASGRVSVRCGVAEQSELDALVGTWPAGRPEGERFAVLEVSDPGEGIDEETLDRVFDPFFSTKGAGRGLGLSAVLGITSAHGGGLHIRSSPGAGTTVRVFLPQSSEPLPERAIPEPMPGGAEQGEILFVDDEPELLRIGAAILEQAGYTVELAPQGARALELLAAHPGRFSLVVLDETMPGMTGAEVLERIRAEHPELPVLRTSGFALERVQASPFTSFLPKPYSMERLQRAVRALLDGSGR